MALISLTPTITIASDTQFFCLPSLGCAAAQGTLWCACVTWTGESGTGGGQRPLACRERGVEVEEVVEGGDSEVGRDRKGLVQSLNSASETSLRSTDFE